MNHIPPAWQRRPAWLGRAAVLLSVALGAAACGGGSGGGTESEPSEEAPRAEEPAPVPSVPRRLASAPLGAAVTGLFLSPAGDLFLNVQHPTAKNPPPHNTASIGVIAGVELDELPIAFPPLPTPDSTGEAQRVMTAVGTYQILAQAGQDFGGAVPFGLGAIVAADGTGTVVRRSNNPDFNAFVPDGSDATSGYLFTNWEDRPGGMSRLHIQKDVDSGEWRVLDAGTVDFAGVQGTWINCFGTLSPWGTPLSSEELFFPETALWNSGTDSGVERLSEYLGSATYPNPYRYGYIVEVTDPTGTPSPIKRLALGRFSHENAVVMPDRRTVYQSDDGERGVLFKFVADRAGDLRSGTLFAARMRQDHGVIDPARAGFAVDWIELGHAEESEVAQWLAEYDGIDPSDYVRGATSYISDADICAWARGRTGQALDCEAHAADYGTAFTDERVAFLESRKAAAALGATAEFKKMEGMNISFAGAQNGSVPHLYLAMSEVGGAMSDGTGHVDVGPNPCGVLYRLPIVDAVGGDYNVKRLEPVLAGKPGGSGGCATDGIANPDNIVVMDDGRVLIGEDSERHRNNLLWVWTPPAGK